jgi:cell division protein ZapA
MKDDTFLIHVVVGGFRFPLRIARKDEELYRRAEKLMARYLIEYEQKYSQRPAAEILTLVAFRLAVLVSKQEFSEDTVPLAEKIQALDDELKALLAKE